MGVTPRDMVQYVYEKELDSSFLLALTMHKENYTIGEITDRVFQKRQEKYYLCSETYQLNLEITDEDVLVALHNGLFVTAFISRNQNQYQLHFLVHQYPISMKAQFDEEILKEVIDYMILKTIIALRLDSEYKVDQYVGNKS